MSEYIPTETLKWRWKVMHKDLKGNKNLNCWEAIFIQDIEKNLDNLTIHQSFCLRRIHEKIMG